MWYHNKKILYTYASSNTQFAWAYIETVGWKRIKPGSADGVTNLFIMLNAARANDRLVSVYVDGSDLITLAYLK